MLRKVVTAHFEDGGATQGTLLVAAARLAPQLDLESTKDSLAVMFGRRRELLGLSDEELLAAPGTRLREVVLGQIAGWHPVLQRIVTEWDTSTLYPITVRGSVPVPPWASANVTLLGDAIHAMSPAAGAGANMALRDAAELAASLAHAAQDTPLVNVVQDARIQSAQRQAGRGRNRIARCVRCRPTAGPRRVDRRLRPRRVAFCCQRPFSWHQPQYPAFHVASESGCLHRSPCSVGGLWQGAGTRFRGADLAHDDHHNHPRRQSRRRRPVAVHAPRSRLPELPQGHAPHQHHLRRAASSAKKQVDVVDVILDGMPTTGAYAGINEAVSSFNNAYRTIESIACYTPNPVDGADDAFCQSLADLVTLSWLNLKGNIDLLG